MNKLSFCFVKKRTLLAVAGTVWMIAGFNVSRMGLIAYSMLEKVSAVHIVLSLLVFTAFASMFLRMSVKHTKRIQSYREDKKPFWYFFRYKIVCDYDFYDGRRYYSPLVKSSSRTIYCGVLYRIGFCTCTCRRFVLVSLFFVYGKCVKKRSLKLNN